jgi:hypothetical protein
LTEIAEAHRYAQSSHKVGNVAVVVAAAQQYHATAGTKR